MSFENGTAAVMICPLSKPLPENYLDLFAARAGGKLDDVESEPVLGWVSGRHLLEGAINESTSICGGHVYMNLRKTERKVPGQLLNAICRREELNYMQAHDSLFVPRKERMLIREDAIERTLPKMIPTISATPFVVDMTENVLYLGASSLAKFDSFLAEFAETVGTECEPVPLSANELMFRLFTRSESDLPPLNLTESTSGADEPMAGRDFLTWLWYEIEVNGGRFEHPQFGEFTFAMEGPLTLSYSPGKTKDPELAGSGENVIKKGNPTLSAEAKAALASGKKLRKARIMMARGDAEKWSYGFDADTFAFTSLKLPEGEEQERHARFEERVTNLHILHVMLETCFRKFAESLMNGHDAATEKALRSWVSSKETL